MLKALLLLVLCFWYGDADADDPYVVHHERTRFQRLEPATGQSPIVCGYECGVRIERDTRGKVGGDPAAINSQLMLWNYVGDGVAAGEFTILCDTQSWQTHPDAGAVCGYFKTTKRGSTNAWAGVFELLDQDNKPGPAVAIEVDMFVVGPAADYIARGDGDQGGRVRPAIDIVGGDEKYRTTGQSSGAQASVGVRVGKTGNGGPFKWLYAFDASEYQHAGLVLRGNGSAGRGIYFAPGSKHVVGIDFSAGQFQSVIRIKRGMMVAFDEYDDLGVRSSQSGELEFTYWDNDQSKRVVGATINPRTGEIRARKFITIP